MSVTFFGIIWMLCICYCLMQKQIKYMVFLTLFAMIFQCNNVFIFSGVGVGPQIITACFFIIKSFFYKSNISCQSKTFRRTCFAYLLFVIYVLINCIFINKSNTYTALVMISVYLLCAYRFTKISYLINISQYEKMFDFIVDFVLVVGFIVCIQKMAGIRSLSLITQLFFNDETSGVVAYHTLSTTRFYSTFMEPSYCSCLIVGAIGYYLLQNKGGFRNITRIVFLVLALVLTRSSTGYGCCAIILLVYLLSNNKKKMVGRLLPIGILGIIMVWAFAPNILNEVIFEKLQTSSGQTRLNWNKASLDAYNSSPIFGVGFATQRASSLFYTLIGELGIVGIILFSLVLLIPLVNFTMSNKENTHKRLTVFIIAVLIGQLIACPDVNFSVFWFGMFGWGLFSNLSDSKEISEVTKLCV